MSSTICIYAFQKNAVDHGGDFDADAINLIKEIYMDDLPKSCKDKAETIRIV